MVKAVSEKRLCVYCQKEPAYVGAKTGTVYAGCYECEHERRDAMLRQILGEE